MGIVTMKTEKHVIAGYQLNHPTPVLLAILETITPSKNPIIAFQITLSCLWCRVFLQGLSLVSSDAFPIPSFWLAVMDPIRCPTKDEVANPLSRCVSSWQLANFLFLRVGDVSMPVRPNSRVHCGKRAIDRVSRLGVTRPPSSAFSHL
jgi:hypothetical protein